MPGTVPDGNLLVSGAGKANQSGLVFHFFHAVSKKMIAVWRTPALLLGPEPWWHVVQTQACLLGCSSQP